MALGKKFKSIKSFSNELQMIRLEYDFSLDGGAIGTIEIGEFEEDHILLDAVVNVKSAATSGGSATVAVGTTASATGIIAATAVASLTTNAVIKGVASTAEKVRVAKDQQIVVTIATAALTAGRIEVILWAAKQ